MWMALLGPLPKPAWFTNAWRLVYIIAVRLVGTVLANAMIFAAPPCTRTTAAGDAHWHISMLADQVAAAGLMMVEESLLTIGLFCWLFLKIAREGEERQKMLDYAGSHGIALDEQRAARAVSGRPRRGAVGAAAGARRVSQAPERYLTMSVPACRPRRGRRPSSRTCSCRA